MVNFFFVIIFLLACGTGKLDTESENGSLSTEEKTNEYTVSMKTEKKSYPLKSEDVEVIIEYEGQEYLTFGLAYAIEKQIDGKWYSIPNDLAFIEIAIILKPSESYQQTISLNDLSYSFPVGTYRVVKEFYLDEKNIKVAATFEITE